MEPFGRVYRTERYCIYTGLETFIEMLQETCGLNEDQLDQICYRNPAWLLGMEA